MRLFWRCVIFGALWTLVLTGLLFGTVGKGSTAAFWLLLPAMRLTNTMVGPIIVTSDSGLENFIAVVLASSVLNTVFYAIFFLVLSKIVALVRRTKSGEVKSW